MLFPVHKAKSLQAHESTCAAQLPPPPRARQAAGSAAWRRAGTPPPAGRRPQSTSTRAQAAGHTTCAVPALPVECTAARSTFARSKQGLHRAAHLHAAPGPRSASARSPWSEQHVCTQRPHTAVHPHGVRVCSTKALDRAPLSRHMAQVSYGAPDCQLGHPTMCPPAQTSQPHSHKRPRLVPCSTGVPATIAQHPLRARSQLCLSFCMAPSLRLVFAPYLAVRAQG